MKKKDKAERVMQIVTELAECAAKPYVCSGYEQLEHEAHRLLSEIAYGKKVAK